MSSVNNHSKIGEIIGIGIANQRIYRYSVNIKYKNIIKTVENVEIKTPVGAWNRMEVREVIDKDAPTATVKYGIILLMDILIL